MDNETTIRVRILIPATGNYGEFNDALYFTSSEHAALQPAQLAAAKQARYTAWTAHIDAERVRNNNPEFIAARQAEILAYAQQRSLDNVLSTDSDLVLTRIITAVKFGASTLEAVRAVMRLGVTPVVPTPTPGPLPGPILPGRP